MPAHNFIDLTGETFGRLTVVSRAINAADGRVQWLCSCSCGDTAIVRGQYLRSGHTQSCGCFQNETRVQNGKAEAIDITNRVFGRLAALWPTEKRTSNGSIVWRCACACGTCCDVTYPHLIAGTSQSCGCWRDEKATAQMTTHGHSRRAGRPSPTYYSWTSMLKRALNSNGWNPSYADVDVCPRWRESFENFLADMGERPEGTTLGRFGDVGDYTPENCKWMTQQEQNMEKVLKRAAMRAREVPATQLAA
jgi:hypothetical protein